MKNYVSFALILTLAGCAGAGPKFTPAPRSAPVSETPVSEAPFIVEPGAAASVGGATIMDVDNPPRNSRTTEGVGATTTPLRKQTVAAAPTSEGGDGRLGETIASVGDPKEPGFWVKTPLVTERMTGRALYPKSGRSVQVQLIPSGGARGSGSQISVAAMRLLDAPLTGLPVLVLYRN